MVRIEIDGIGVLENPVVTQRPEGYVMLASEGDWTRCGYRTLWLSSPTLLDWTAARTVSGPHVS